MYKAHLCIRRTPILKTKKKRKKVVLYQGPFAKKLIPVMVTLSSIPWQHISTAKQIKWFISSPFFSPSFCFLFNTLKCSLLISTFFSSSVNSCTSPLSYPASLIPMYFMSPQTSVWPICGDIYIHVHVCQQRACTTDKNNIVSLMGCRSKLYYMYTVNLCV